LGLVLYFLFKQNNNKEKRKKWLIIVSYGVHNAFPLIFLWESGKCNLRVLDSGSVEHFGSIGLMNEIDLLEKKKKKKKEKRRRNNKINVY